MSRRSIPSAWLLVLLTACPVLGWNPGIQRVEGAARWDVASPVIWNPDGGPLGQWSNAQARAEVDAAFDVWQSVATSSIAYAEGAQIVNGLGAAVDVGPSNFFEIFNLDNGQNPIIFDNDREIFAQIGQPQSVLGIGGVLRVESDGEITKAFVVLQGEWFDGASGGAGETSADGFRSMIVHEVGHFSGLGHSTVNGGLPSGGLPGCPPPTDAELETMNPITHDQALTLHNDDAVGISALYPEPIFQSAFTSVVGRLFQRNGIDGFDGANVVLRPDTSDCSARYQGAQATQSGVNPAESGGAGGYRFDGLPPSGAFTVLAESIEDAGSYPIGGSSPPAMPGPADYYNGPNESSFGPPDDPDEVGTIITGSAGSLAPGVDIFINNPGSPGEIPNHGSQALELQAMDGLTPLPATSLQLDDGGADAAYGISGKARLAWINRLDPPATQLPFSVERLQILFNDPSAPQGRPIRLLVYVDPAGTKDPANATLVHTQDVTIQFLDDEEFNEFVLNSPVMVSSGDVYVGVFDLQADNGPENLIATLDLDTIANRGYLQVEGFLPGGFASTSEAGLTGWTWMIRAVGAHVPPAGTVALTWGESCNAQQVPEQDYVVYEGDLGQLRTTGFNHVPITCGTLGLQSWIVSGDGPDRYWLVVPILSSREGTAGKASPGVVPRYGEWNCAMFHPDSCP